MGLVCLVVDAHSTGSHGRVRAFCSAERAHKFSQHSLSGLRSQRTLHS